MRFDTWHASAGSTLGWQFWSGGFLSWQDAHVLLRVLHKVQNMVVGCTLHSLTHEHTCHRIGYNLLCYPTSLQFAVSRALIPENCTRDLYNSMSTNSLQLLLFHEIWNSLCTMKELELGSPLIARDIIRKSRRLVSVDVAVLPGYWMIPIIHIAPEIRSKEQVIVSKKKSIFCSPRTGILATTQRFLSVGRLCDTIVTALRYLPIIFPDFRGRILFSSSFFKQLMKLFP